MNLCKPQPAMVFMCTKPNWLDMVKCKHFISNCGDSCFYFCPMKVAGDQPIIFCCTSPDAQDSAA